ncbi:MAG TPA: hypothetical protein PKC21_06635 [Oligoflexia bacterium]|nr:hypothetical protein [Oligoflexia bacterium]HMR25012.1 hypothetical protein [Oligoflexia bacterium]
MKQINIPFTQKKISFIQWLLSWGVLFLIGSFCTEYVLKNRWGFSLSMYWLYFIGTVGLISYEFIRREPSIIIANIYAAVLWLLHAFLYTTILMQYVSGHYEALKVLYVLTIIEIIIVSVFLVTKILVGEIKSKDINNLE